MLLLAFLMAVAFSSYRTAVNATVSEAGVLDSTAETDANFVLTGSGNIVEVQATAEKTPFTETQFSALLALARKGVAKLVDLQKMAVM